MFRFIIKEASLLFAFVVLGCLLLVSVWITGTVAQSILREFQSTQISVILKDGASAAFMDIVEKNSDVVRYELSDAAKNKARIGELYPELRNLIAPLENRFFPSSAVITTSKPDRLLNQLKQHPELYETQIVHQPPMAFKHFLDLLTAVFSALWLITLTLVLYFNLERITVKEEARWSLMKMLGARPAYLFFPLWYGQAIRVGIASLSAILLTVLMSHHIRTLFAWDWTPLPLATLVNFFILSIVVTSLISAFLFFSKYRRIAIG